MVELCGARMVPGHDRRGRARAGAAPRSRCAATRLERAARRARSSPTESQAILERLGFGVERRDGDLEVEVPYFRHYDVYREADLIEEVARVHGLHQLPATLPARREAVGGLSRDAEAAPRRSRTSCAARGLSEAVTFSFISPDAVRRLRLAGRRPRARVLPIANPLSEDQSVMRTTLLPGLLEVARHNVARDMRGPAPVRDAGACSSRRAATSCPTSGCTSAIAAGRRLRAARRGGAPALPADFYAAKGLLVGAARRCSACAGG